MAQRSVAEPVVRDGAQLLLDGPEGVAPPRLGVDGQRERVFGGEPADRTGEIQVLEEILAAVSLHADQHRVPTGPARQRPAERAQQHIVDPRPVDTRDLAQQRPGLGPAEDRGHRGRRLMGVGALAVDGERGGRGAGHARPVRQIAVEPAGAHVFRQPGGPSCEGAARRGQRGRATGGGAAVRGLQVAEQHPPGDAVHHQMVGGEQQLGRPPWAEGEQQHPQYGPLGDVQPPLGRDRGLPYGGGACRVVQAGQVVPLQDTVGGGGKDLLPPLSVDGQEAGAQRRVLRHQGVHRLPQGGLVEVAENAAVSAARSGRPASA
ncbi:hypothetical protein SANTM175S_02479 [Streptomyces antimycoticus]